MKFDSSNGKNSIYYEIYGDTIINPLGVIIIVHGMQEYGKRYLEFKDYLNKNGYIVVLYDQLGHGNSVEKLDDLGFFNDNDGYKNLIFDLHILKGIIKEKYANLKLYLIGHSMGSFVLRNYLYNYSKEEDLAGTIIIGTAGPNPLLNLGLMISKISKKKNPKKRNKFINNLAFGSYKKKFKNETPVAWICSDLEIQKKYLKDPYCNFIFTTSAFSDLFNLLKNISSPKWAKGLNKKTPILLLSGEIDPVGNYKKGVMKVYKWLTNENKNMILYPKMRHEILNEKGKEEVYNDILNWLRKN